MSLRKSPKRTPALLAANRANARKSTGPRTPMGKWHSAANAVRHYRRTRPSSCIPIENREIRDFEDFYCALREAIMPADNAAGTEAVLLNAARVWRVKRSFDRWIATRTEEDWLVLDAGAVPRPHTWRLKLKRPGLSAPDWMVTASVCLRWGRGPGLSRRSATEDDERPGGPRMDTPRMHTIVSVHTTGPRDVARASRPCPSRPGWPCHEQGEPTEPECERTKPESLSSQSTSENMSVPGDWDPAYVEAYGLAERFVGWLMGWGKRTKPESLRKHEACKNMSPAGEVAGRNPNGSDGAISFGRVLRALKTVFVPRKEYSQLPLFQTKPEHHRKEGSYKNTLKSRGWLAVAAASFMLKRGFNRSPIPATNARTFH